MKPDYDEVGLWSEMKLEIERDYATEYSRIMSKQRLTHIYIDAFAGAGIHLSRTTGEFIPGSPLNALMVDPPFKEYHFIDLNGKKVDHLNSLFGQRSDINIHHGDCNQIMLEKVLPKVQWKDYRRGLCLLDP
jgi:three-Cys-motif partner protein